MRWLSLTLVGLVLFARPVGAWQDEGGKGETVSPLVDLRNEVEAATKVKSRVPEGSLVQKGGVVITLDDSPLRTLLTSQQIAVGRAQADLENANKTREVAEIAVMEYKEGIFPQQIQNIEGEKALAEAEQARANERLQHDEQMFQKGLISDEQVIADRLSKLKAEISKDQAERKMKVLQEYTYPKQMTELQAAVEKAKSDELAKKLTLELEQVKEQKIRQQIENCEVRSSIVGLVVYPIGRHGIEVGSRPLALQILARIVPIPGDH